MAYINTLPYERIPDSEFEKYGLAFIDEKLKCKAYERNVGRIGVIRVLYKAPIITVSTIDGGHETIQCERYFCEDAERLKYLLTAGRLGYLFK